VRGSRLIAIFVISSLLFTSVVYACSGLNSMPIASMSAAMDHSAVERGPCNKHKLDICKSVRYQMLSLQPLSPPADALLYRWAIFQAAHFELPPSINFLPETGPPGFTWHPVSKLSFPFSNQVLRI
jgi:hypothetical protein